MSRKATKPTSRASRRPSHSTRTTARSRVSVGKPVPRRKPEPEGATLGMNAKKTTQRQGFKTHEFIVYPAHGVGQIVAIAEVVRDLFRSETQPEQSYSERQLYEAALDRLSREVSAVQRITETEAIKEIEAALAKGPRRGPKSETEEEAVVEEEAA